MHDVVKAALIKDGWTITHDPYRLTFGEHKLYVDLGAERMIGAEKGTERIAVEVKSFLGASDMHELETALGQFVLYGPLIEREDERRQLFLAIPEVKYRDLLAHADGQLLIGKMGLRFFTVQRKPEEIVRWQK
jgi:hypothetical protein